jgi:hypothetical protein
LYYKKRVCADSVVLIDKSDIIYWMHRNLKGVDFVKKLALFLILLFSVMSFATWMPLEDYSGVKYVYYKINYTQYEEEKEMIYGVEIGLDEEKYILNYNTTVFLSKDQPIGSDVLFEQELSMFMYTFLNPMFSFFYETIDLNEQMNTKLYGFGSIKYEGQVTVQGKKVHTPVLKSYFTTKITSFPCTGSQPGYPLSDSHLHERQLFRWFDHGAAVGL